MKKLIIFGIYDRYNIIDAIIQIKDLYNLYFNVIFISIFELYFDIKKQSSKYIRYYMYNSNNQYMIIYNNKYIMNCYNYI